MPRKPRRKVKAKKKERREAAYLLMLYTERWRYLEMSINLTLTEKQASALEKCARVAKEELPFINRGEAHAREQAHKILKEVIKE